MGNGRHDVAQICLNGHLITDLVQRKPHLTKKFCESCGAATITTCPRCNAEIHGVLLPVRGIRMAIPVPAFCYNCGTPYPWTESALEATRELAQEVEGLTEEERSILQQSLDDIVADNPRTTLAATRWKKILSKLGPEATGMFREVLVGVISETAKKLLWP